MTSIAVDVSESEVFDRVADWGNMKVFSGDVDDVARVFNSAEEYSKSENEFCEKVTLFDDNQI